MTFLLWARTNRRLNTYDPGEIDVFADRLRDGAGAGIQVPFEGGDHLLWSVHFLGGIHNLKRLISPFMVDDLVENWCLTEVGAGIGPEVERKTIRESLTRVHTTWDDRFIHPSDLQRDGDGENFERIDLPDVEGLSHLDWRLDYDAGGKTGLWVDFKQGLEENRHLITRLERALPGQVTKMWHGRSSLLFGFISSHDLREPAAYGINDAVGEILDDEEVAYWLGFQIGNASVGGVIENMNQLSDFIWRSQPRRTRKGEGQARSALRPSRSQIVVVTKPLRNLRPSTIEATREAINRLRQKRS